MRRPQSPPPLLVIADLPPADLAFSVILTRRSAWMALARRGDHNVLVYLVPTAGLEGWWVAVMDEKDKSNGPRGSVVGLTRPVDRAGASFVLRDHFGIDLGAADWQPTDDYRPADNNPVLDSGQPA